MTRAAITAVLAISVVFVPSAAAAGTHFGTARFEARAVPSKWM